MTVAPAEFRRIALRVSGAQHDLAVPKGDALAQALTAVGVQLGAGDRVFSPEGAQIDTALPAAELREGGLYSVVSAASTSVERDAAFEARRVRTAPWALATFAAVTALVAVLVDAPGWRLTAGLICVAAALVTALVWGRRERASWPLLASMVLAAAAGALLVPARVEHLESTRAASAWLAIAVLAGFLMVSARSARLRAAAAALVAVAAAVAAIVWAGRFAGWGLPECAMVLAAAAAVGVRAAPSLLVGVDEGYHIDYGRFMVLRWTVRGRVPEYRAEVAGPEVRERIGLAEARLEITVLVLSLLAALGLPAAALPLTGDGLAEQIAAAVFAVCVPAALMLSSRRTAARRLRLPPRVAVAVGLAGFVGVLALHADPALLLAVGGILFAVGLVAAAVVVPLTRGGRSLGWSRLADVADSLAVALCLPAALLAAGTLNMLRGALV